MYRVGIISGAETFSSIADGFQNKMAELGYIEGRKIVYDLWKLNNDSEGAQRIAKQFIKNKVDLILTFPTEPSLAAKTAIQGTSTPMVFAMACLEGNNLVESIPNPGGNITGVRYPGPELTVKRFELLLEIMPQIKRVYLIYDAHYPNASNALKQLRSAALSSSVSLVEDPVSNLPELQHALHERAALEDIGIDAILLMPDILDHSPDGFSAILKFAEEHKVPIGGGMDFTAELGALFSYAPDNIEMGMLAATLADKIFKGAPAGTLMVVTPKAHLWLNYNVIKELRFNVSEGLLGRAKKIIH